MGLFDDDRVIIYITHTQLLLDDKAMHPIERMDLFDDDEETMHHDHMLLLLDDIKMLHEIMDLFDDDQQIELITTNQLYDEENLILYGGRSDLLLVDITIL